MPYILLDEKRFEKAYYSNSQEGLGLVETDTGTPSSCYKLKENYKEFSGEEQWEIDPEKEQKEKKLEALEKDWDNLPKGVQVFFKNNYDDVKVALQAGNKAEAVQLMTDIESLVPDKLKSKYQNLLEKIQNF